MLKFEDDKDIGRQRHVNVFQGNCGILAQHFARKATDKIDEEERG